jgi:hypothetical protein
MNKEHFIFRYFLPIFITLVVIRSILDLYFPSIADWLHLCEFLQRG